MVKKKKHPYRLITSVVIILVICIVIIVSLGVIGLISVPGISPSVQSYPSATELSYDSMRQYLPESEDGPSLDDLVASGLSLHVYGTSDTGAAVRSYYDSMMLGWNEEVDDSGPGWSYSIWRSNLYGFGIAVYDHAIVKQRTGYNTVYVTVDGPASAWLPLLT